MKEIKEIYPKDAVWCWVGNTHEEIDNKEIKRLVIGKSGSSFIAVTDGHEQNYLGYLCRYTKKSICPEFVVENGFPVQLNGR